MVTFECKPPVDWAKIQYAYEAVAKGMSRRVDIDKKILVYAVGTNLIRIDVKQ